MSGSPCGRWAGLACCGAVVFSLSGCANPGGAAQDKTLIIRWQRLVDDAGDTCGRCGGTERSIADAQRILTAALKPVGVGVRVIKTQLTAEQFDLDPSESNRIWVGDDPLETVLGASTGASACAGCCGDRPCRTTVVDGRSYDAIPVELIVRAGLRVAADLVQPAAPASACGPGRDGPAETGESDLQPMPWLSR